MIHMHTKVWDALEITVAFPPHFYTCIRKEYLYCQISTEEEELLDITNFWELLIQGKRIFFL